MENKGEQIKECDGYDREAELYHEGAVQVRFELMKVITDLIDSLTSNRYQLQQGVKLIQRHVRVIQKLREVGLKFCGRAESSKIALRDINSKLIALSNSMKQKSFKHQSIESRILAINDDVCKAMEMDKAIDKGLARYGRAEMLFNEAVKN